MIVPSSGGEDSGHVAYKLTYEHNMNELSLKLVFGMMNQAATWSDAVTSIRSLNFTPVMTFAR